MNQLLMQFKSHIEGKNADVSIYVDRVEWELQRGISPTKVTAGVFTGGLSLAGTGVRRRRAGSEVIPVKAISSVTTKRDGLRFTLVRVICSGNTIDFRVGHAEARDINALLTDLVLGRHPAQQQGTPEAAWGGPVAPQPVVAVGVADELVKLAQLRDAGALTREEFEEQKSRLLR